MRTSILPAATLTAALLLCSTPAVAASETGPYAGLFVARSHYRIEHGDLSEPRLSEGKTSFESDLTTDDFLRNGTVGLTVGWQLTRWLALEGRYADLGVAKYSYMATEPGLEPASLSTSVMTDYSADAASGSAVLTLPLTERFSIGARVGASYSRSKEEIRETLSEYGVYVTTTTQTTRDSDVALTFGAGLEFEVKRHVSFRLDWQRVQVTSEFDATAHTGGLDGFAIDLLSFSGLWRL